MSLVLLSNAAESTGAVCLDGTPGAYYWRPGHGAYLRRNSLELVAFDLGHLSGDRLPGKLDVGPGGVLELHGVMGTAMLDSLRGRH